MKLRVHTVGKDGLVYQKDEVLNVLTGRKELAKRSTNGPIDLDRSREIANKKGFPLIVENNNNSQNLNLIPMKRGLNPGAGSRTLNLAELPGGAVVQGRFEAPAVDAQTKKWVITVDNTSGGAAATLFIGDSAGILGDSKSASIPAGTVIDGPWGSDTLSIIKLLTSGMGNAIDLHGLHIQGDAASSVNALVISKMKADIAGNNANEERIYLQDLLKGSTYQDTVREDPSFRFSLNNMSGIYLSVADGDTITLTFHVSAIGEGGLMMQV